MNAGQPFLIFLMVVVGGGEKEARRQGGVANQKSLTLPPKRMSSPTFSYLDS